MKVSFVFKNLYLISISSFHFLYSLFCYHFGRSKKKKKKTIAKKPHAIKCSLMSSFREYSMWLCFEHWRGKCTLDEKKRKENGTKAKCMQISGGSVQYTLKKGFYFWK